MSRCFKTVVQTMCLSPCCKVGGHSPFSPQTYKPKVYNHQSKSYYNKDLVIRHKYIQQHEIKNIHETTEWVVPATVLSLPWILNLFRIATPRSLIMFPSAFPLTTGLWSGSARSLPHSKPQSWVGGWKRKNLKSERLTTVK